MLSDFTQKGRDETAVRHKQKCSRRRKAEQSVREKRCVPGGEDGAFIRACVTAVSWMAKAGLPKVFKTGLS